MREGDRSDAVTLGRAVGNGALHTVATEQGGQVLDPSPKTGGRDALAINVPRLVNNTKDVVDEEVDHGARHASEPVDEEIDWVSKVHIKRAACSFGGISPGVIVVQPNISKSISVCMRSRILDASLTY